MSLNPSSESQRQLFSTQHVLLAAILVVYVVVAGLFAVHTPPWQAPDEPAHYNYIAQVAENGCCPVIEVGDWNSAYLDELKTAHFAPELLGNFAAIQYEDHQPPLYYLLQSLVYKLTDGSLIALRLFSALLGGGIVLCTYAVGILLLPDRPQVALGAATLTAFLPQHLAILTSVNNDFLSGLIIGLTLLGTLHYLRGDRVKPWHLGLLVGIGLLTKLSTLFLGGIVPLAILLKWWSGRRDKQLSIRALISPLISFALPALILGGIMWVHNVDVYGFPDVFGQRQHNLVVADQPRTAALIASVGFGQYLQTALQTTFNSFWGQFGWMALPLPEWMYPLFLALLIVAGTGLIINRVSVKKSTVAWQWNAWVILAITALLAVLAYIYYNLEFLQLQGRYMFAGIIPFSLGMALGIDAWRRLLLKRFSIARWLTIAVFLLLAPLDIYLLLRFIEPLLKP